MTRRLQFKVDLIHGPIFQSLLFFAIPLFFSNVFQQLYNTVDTMIVGHALGDLSLAAIGSCAAIYDLLIGFALGIGNGLAIVTARSYGANDTELLKKSVAASIVIGLLTSLVLTVGAEVILMPLLKMLDTPPEIIAEAFSYISVITRFTLVMFAYNLCAGLLRAIGNSFMPLVFLVLSSCLNIGLDLFFITQLNMGVGGAAVATVIAQGISVVLCLIYILKKAPVLIPQRRHFKVKRGNLRGDVRSGLVDGLYGQHRCGGFRRAAVWHQQSGNAGDCGAYRGAQAVHVLQHAVLRHGDGDFDVCFAEPGRGSADADSQGDAVRCAV